MPSPAQSTTACVLFWVSHLTYRRQMNTRPPVDVCCVVDVSGSMGDAATCVSHGTTNEFALTSCQDSRQGQSRCANQRRAYCSRRCQSMRRAFQRAVLPLVTHFLTQHAIKAVAHTLNPKDRLCIVSFNTDARVQGSVVRTLPVHALNALCSSVDRHGTRHRESGHPLTLLGLPLFILKQIDAALDSLNADGGTNIWKGLNCGLDHMLQAASGDESYRKKFIFLLTDGQVRTANFRTVLPVTPRVCTVLPLT